MLYHSAVALSQMPTDAEMAEGRVFPRIETIRECSYGRVSGTVHA